MAIYVKTPSLNIGFPIGFVYGIWMFVMINYLTYRWFKAPFDKTVFCDPCIRQFGFPATLYEQERWAQAGSVMWFGLTFDVLFAAVSAILIGLFCNHVWSRVSKSGFRSSRSLPRR